MMQRLVIKVAMDEPSSCCFWRNQRSRALKIAVGVPGVELAALAGQDNNHLVVTGDGIDAVKLTRKLRKKVGHSELVSVGPLNYGGDIDSKVYLPVGEYHPYNPRVYGPGLGYDTKYQNSYSYGPDHGYEIRSQNQFDYGPGHGYDSRYRNSDSCSIM